MTSGCSTATGPTWSTMVKTITLAKMTAEGRQWCDGSVVVGFRVFGAPQFSVQRSQNTCFKRFGVLWAEIRCAPKTRNPTAMDPTPHSQPLNSQDQNQVGRKRHLDVTTQKLPRDDFCPSIVLQLLKVWLQEYGYSLFCSHSSRCLEALM